MSEFQDNSRPFVCSAKLTSFEDGVRVSAETQKISEFGMTLRLLEDADLPKRISVLIPDYQINIGCQVVWRHRDDVGLQFDRKIELLEMAHSFKEQSSATG